MTRTTKDIFISGIGIAEVKTLVLEWFKENKVKVLNDTPDYVYGRWGRGILSASKFFEVTLVPTEGGVTAKTEGWIAYIPPSFWPDPRAYVPETEFSESEFYIGIPKREGMKAIKRLWATLEALSKNTTST
jgi:hypothetical protein